MEMTCRRSRNALERRQTPSQPNCFISEHQDQGWLSDTCLQAHSAVACGWASKPYRQETVTQVIATTNTQSHVGATHLTARTLEEHEEPIIRTPSTYSMGHVRRSSVDSVSIPNPEGYSRPSSLTQPPSILGTQLSLEQDNLAALEALGQDGSSSDSEGSHYGFTPESSGTYSYLNDAQENSLSEDGEVPEMPPLIELDAGGLMPFHHFEERQSPQAFWTWDFRRQRWIHQESDGIIIECPEELD